jgi:hypothetical protein
MITTGQETLDTKKELLENKKKVLLENKKLVKIIRDWAGKNKKIFWKYELSCFYKTYIIRIANLPNPSTEDIVLSSNNRLLNNQQKTQLSDAIIKACVKAQVLSDSHVEVQIDYVDGAVVAEIV